MTVHGLFGGKEVTQCMPDNTVRERSVIWTASVLNVRLWLMMMMMMILHWR